MPKYMMICRDEDGDIMTMFYDKFSRMDDARMNAEVSMGCYCEMYERRHIDDNEFAPLAYLPI